MVACEVDSETFEEIDLMCEVKGEMKNFYMNECYLK